MLSTRGTDRRYSETCDSLVGLAPKFEPDEGHNWPEYQTHDLDGPKAGTASNTDAIGNERYQCDQYADYEYGVPQGFDVHFS
jgi:IS1 family transposase